MPNKFELDDFQKKAIQFVEDGCSVIVSAPTGAGKTVIAEYVVRRCLESGEGVIYTAPVKALSNQKYREFQKVFPSQVGIVTGDVSINHRAPLVIMTTEIFRNRILEKRADISNHTWIIFDEIHYLDDLERGTVWEESLILLPSHMRFVGLSATIPNLEELARWLKGIHPHPLRTIRENLRPVPLHFSFQCRGKFVDDINRLHRLAYTGNRRTSHFTSAGPRRTSGPHASRGKNRPVDLIDHLIRTGRLPCIYFSFSRKRCEYLALTSRNRDLLDYEENTEILHRYDQLCERFNITGDERSEQMRLNIAKGIAYHHAGLHPMLKEVIEQLFTRRLIKVIFTTETFALGINMPARTVVLDALRKKYGRFFRRLKTRDFFQMAGRSGRRGIDKEGFVYSRLDFDEMGYRELRAIFEGQPEPVLSRFNVSYATILNLYEQYQDELLSIYPRSLHFSQAKDKHRNAQLRQMKARIRILKQLNYIKGDELTEKGRFAKNVYGYELPMTELYASGLLASLSSKQLGILCLAMVYEPRPRSKKPRLVGDLKSLGTAANRQATQLHQLERRERITPLSKRFYFDLSASMIAWMGKQPFNEVLAFADHDEGEIIRYFRMSIQILRELLEAPVSGSFKEKIGTALHMVNHGVVDAENQLKVVIEGESLEHT